jgi:N,N'-diacetyllegionaminate synthase
VKSIDVGKIRIGPDHPCFIIAEAGVNHNGDKELAMRLVSAALQAGADAVKFQTWITDKIVTPDAPAAEYQLKESNRKISQYELLRSLELNFECFTEVKAYADRCGILCFSTPDEEQSADFLDEDIKTALFKIGSGELTNIPFLKHVARKGKPVILSTGMSYLGEVENAVRAVKETGNEQLALLHCVSNYPAEPAWCNLKAMDTLGMAFGYPIGFSDHTTGTEVALAAAARGACIIEKHLTLDRKLPGPDHRFSMEPTDFRALVDGVRAVERALGDGIKTPAASEVEMRTLVRKYIVAAGPLMQGDTLTEDKVTFRRSGGGLDPVQLPLVLGRKLKRSIEANTIITLDMLN